MARQTLEANYWQLCRYVRALERRPADWLPLLLLAGRLAREGAHLTTMSQQ